MSTELLQVSVVRKLVNMGPYGSKNYVHAIWNWSSVKVSSDNCAVAVWIATRATSDRSRRDMVIRMSRENLEENRQNLVTLWIFMYSEPRNKELGLRNTRMERRRWPRLNLAAKSFLKSSCAYGGP